MKNIYPFVLLCTLIISSCKKLDPEYKMVGTWKLDDVVRRRFLNNSHLHTGYENGLFTFNENGTASYKDTNTLQGSWSMRREYRSYYDNNGDYRTENNVVLRIFLANFASNRIIDWEFDDTDFKRSSNRLDGFIYTLSSEYQYSFRRQ
ncbi:MAG: hypothetical protein U0V75_08425 [Ferruginibacter sp.]